MLLKERGAGQYYNWDDLELRKLWITSPKGLITKTSPNTIPVFVFDEIHKARYWKRTLKGIFDTLSSAADIVVTGSARLDIYQKGSDSLLGRYFPFRLHPLTLGELGGSGVVSTQDFIEQVYLKSQRENRASEEALQSLLKLSGFPEPFFGQSEKSARIWRRTRVEQVIREDLRDLSRIPHLSQLEMLAALLPERIGSLLSKASLSRDLEVGFDTVKRWLDLLRYVYYCFEIKPYTQKIARSLKKEGKLYLWDYAEIPAEGARFENLVACHLLKSCHYWTDGGEGHFQLFFLRNKEKEEIDFLITKDKKPWLPIEVKLNDTEPSSSWNRFFSYLPVKKGLQIVLKPYCWKIHHVRNNEVLVASANLVLPYFV